MKHNLTNLLINIYFALTDACDMLLREIEYRIHYIEGGELKHEVKQAHNLMMQSAREFHKRYDLYLEKCKIECMPNKGDYDKGRADATRPRKRIRYLCGCGGCLSMSLRTNMWTSSH